MPAKPMSLFHVAGTIYDLFYYGNSKMQIEVPFTRPLRASLLHRPDRNSSTPTQCSIRSWDDFVTTHFVGSISEESDQICRSVFTQAYRITCKRDGKSFPLCVSNLRNTYIIYQRHEKLSLGPSIINRTRRLLCHTLQRCASNPCYENCDQSGYAVSSHRKCCPYIWRLKDCMYQEETVIRCLRIEE